MSDEKKPPAIYGQIHRVMKELEAVGKDSENKQQGYRFRGIDAVTNEVHPLFAKHGVDLEIRLQDLKREERPSKSGGIAITSLVIVNYRAVSLTDGSFVESTVPGEGADHGDKSTGKAMSMALKTFLNQALLIPTQDKAYEGDETSYEAAAPAKPVKTRDPGIAERPSKAVAPEAPVVSAPAEPEKKIEEVAPAKSWRDVVWHPKYGKVNATAPEFANQLYHGHTLGWIAEHDNAGISWWAENFGKDVGDLSGITEASRKNAILVTALGEARAELLAAAKADQQKSEAQGAVEASQLDEHEILLQEVREFLAGIGKNEDWLFALLQTYGRADGKNSLEEVENEHLKAVLNKKTTFEKLAKS